MTQRRSTPGPFWSIRWALSLIVLLAVLPAICIIVITGLENKHRAEQYALQSAWSLIHSLDEVHKGVLDEARGTLGTLAMLPIVKSRDAQACNWFFARMLAERPTPSNILLAGLDGKVIASGLPPFLGTDVSDRTYFRQALATQSLSVGDFILGRTTGKPIQVFSLPVRDPAGSVVGVIAISYLLDGYEKHLHQAVLPPSARITFADHAGVRMLAFPPSPSYPQGKPVTPEVWGRIQASPQDEGSFRVRRPSGQEGPLLFKRQRLPGAAEPYMTIAISFSDSDIFNESSNLMLRDLALVALAAVLALFVARVVRNRLLLRDLDGLLSAVERLGKGELAARADAARGCAETRRLSAAFNEMAQALEARQSELEDAAKTMGAMRNTLNNVLESMPSAVIGLDGQGMVTLWNGGAQRMLGLAAREAMGRPLGGLVPWLTPRLDAARQARQAMQFESVPVQEGEDLRFVDVLAYPLAADGEGMVVRLDDVTRRVRMEMVMVQNEKMSIMGSLAGGMAHDINNPLAGILQSVQNIQRRVQPSLEANRKAADGAGVTVEAVEAYLKARGVLDFLETIKESGQRAARIVKNMLGFIRKSSSAHVPVQLSELLDRTVEIAGTDYDLTRKFDFRSIAIVRKYDPGLPSVPCSPTDLEQVIYNLLANAAQAMASAPRKDGTPKIVLRLRREDDFAVIEVEDNGPGMEEHVRRRVFEPLFSTKGPGEGTGLGLSLSYFIVVHTHQGAISVESEKGKGARFIIKLPINPGDPQPLQARPA